MPVFDIIIMAAGQGKRMYSSLPKVLHTIAGKPMLEHVVETAASLCPERIFVVIGHEGALIQKELSHLKVDWVWQKQPLGTGHAVLQALHYIPEDRSVLVLSGDVPLIQKDTLLGLIKACDVHPHTPNVLGLLLANLPEPTGLGRIIRNSQGMIQAIIEEKDAEDQHKAIKEIYTGICYVMAQDLHRWLPCLSNHNEQKEYYLTNILSCAVTEGMSIVPCITDQLYEIAGVNNQVELQNLERAWQARIALQLMHAGVTLADASRIDIRGTLKCGKDVFIDVNVLFIGDVFVNDGTHIGPHCMISNTRIGKNCHVLANSVLDSCLIADECDIGPFARMRPGTQLASGCKVGNFVETKNATLAMHSKASHLSYLGDVTIGEHVNIGAGTITCNYDGVNKHHTVIEDGVFIGSDTQLVAPITVGKNATIGAGTTLRRNAPAEALTLTDSKQKTIYDWQRPAKKK